MLSPPHTPPYLDRRHVLGALTAAQRNSRRFRPKITLHPPSHSVTRIQSLYPYQQHPLSLPNILAFVIRHALRSYPSQWFLSEFLSILYDIFLLPLYSAVGHWESGLHSVSFTLSLSLFACRVSKCNLVLSAYLTKVPTFLQVAAY